MWIFQIANIPYFQEVFFVIKYFLLSMLPITRFPYFNYKFFDTNLLNMWAQFIINFFFLNQLKI